MKTIRVMSHGPRSLGWPGVVGLGMIASVSGFWLSTIRPEQSRLDDLRAEAAIVRAQRTTAPKDLDALRSPSEKLAVFYGSFPKPREVPDLLEKVFAAARAEGLRLEQGEYRVMPHNADGLAELQLSLPVRGPYPQIRRFVDAAMLEISSLVLENIQFERQKVGDTGVEARIKLVAYLGKKP